MVFKERGRNLEIGEVVKMHTGPKSGQATILSDVQVYVAPDPDSYLYVGKAKNGRFVSSPTRISEPAVFTKASVSATSTEARVEYQGFRLHINPFSRGR